GRHGEAPPFVADTKEEVRRWWGAGISIMGAGCGLENPNNFVDIDPDAKDAWGIPAPRIHLKFRENHAAMIRDLVQRGSELIEAAGGKVITRSASPSVPGSQIHEQGTCRLGDDAKKFVTNRWGQCP